MDFINSTKYAGVQEEEKGETRASYFDQNDRVASSGYESSYSKHSTTSSQENGCRSVQFIQIAEALGGTSAQRIIGVPSAYRNREVCECLQSLECTRFV